MTENLDSQNQPKMQTPLADQPNQVVSTPTPIAPVPQQQFTYAGFWVRYGALFVDGVVLGIPIYVTAGLMTLLPTVIPAFINTLVPGLVFLVADIYFIAHFGATPGKMFFGLKVVRPNGSAPGISKAIMREFVGKLVSGLLLNIGYLWAAFDNEKQAIHDKIAGTHVVLLKPVTGFRKFLIFLFCFTIPLAILGILAAAVLIAINPAQRVQQAKDTARKSDIGMIATELQGYYGIHNTYPKNLTQIVSAEGLKRLPMDPTGESYTYLVSPDGTRVAVYANLTQEKSGKFSVWCWRSSTYQQAYETTTADCRP